MRPSLPARLAPLALAAALAACKPSPPPSPEAAVRAVLAEVAESARAGDRAGLLRAYAPDFSSIYPGAASKQELATFLARDPAEWRAFQFEDAFAWARVEEGQAWALTLGKLTVGEMLSDPLPPAARATLHQLRRSGGAWRIESFRAAALREPRGWIDAALGAPTSSEVRSVTIQVDRPGVVEVALPDAGAIVPDSWEIENAGAAVRGFRMTPEGGGVWDVAEVVSGAKAANSDADALARALWRFVTLHRISSQLDPPEALRGAEAYLAASGEGQCGWTARALASLWKAAGLEARVYLLGGHAAAEVRVGDRWRLYDADQGAYYEAEGDVLSASLLARRPQAVEALADALGRGPGGLPAREMAALYADWKHHGTEDAPAASLAPLGIDLAPGDRLTLRWREDGPVDLRAPQPLFRAQGELAGPNASATGLAAFGAEEKAAVGKRFRFPISPWLPPYPRGDARRVRVAFETDGGAPAALRLTYRYRVR